VSFLSAGAVCKTPADNKLIDTHHTDWILLDYTRSFWVFVGILGT